MVKKLVGRYADLCVETVNARPYFSGNVEIFLVVVGVKVGGVVGLVEGLVHVVWSLGVFVSRTDTDS